MQAHDAWAAYTAAIIGASVEDAADKFAALSEAERNAWAAVVAVQAPVAAPTQKGAALPELPKAVI